jgi:hypothetical protein
MRRIAMKWAAVMLGVLPIAFVGAVGVAAMALPARNQSPLDWVPLVDLASLPSNGAPELVPVIVPYVDGWIRHPDRQVDAMFVRRTSDGEVTVFYPRHHLGAWVAYDARNRCFHSCCFGVEFDLDGKVMPAWRSHAFQDLRTAEARVSDGAVFVRNLWNVRQE